MQAGITCHYHIAYRSLASQSVCVNPLRRTPSRPCRTGVQPAGPFCHAMSMDAIPQPPPNGTLDILAIRTRYSINYTYSSDTRASLLRVLSSLCVSPDQ